MFRSVLFYARVLGGSEYMDILCDMRKGTPEINGAAYFSDPRLVANGFQIKVFPGMFHNRNIDFIDCFLQFGNFNSYTVGSNRYLFFCLFVF